jgi:hypothetical protein
MKRRHLLMGAALLVAAGLVLFGDRTPSDGVAEPVERAARMPAAAVPRAAVRPAGEGAGGEAAILRLIPRATLIGEAGEAAFHRGEGVFLGQNWNPPPPPAPSAAVHGDRQGRDGRPVGSLPGAR